MKIVDDFSFRLSEAGRQLDVAYQRKRQGAQHLIAADGLRFALLKKSYLHAFLVLIDFDDRRVVTNLFFQARRKRPRQIVISTFDFAEPGRTAKFGTEKFSQAVSKTVDRNFAHRVSLRAQS